jgi:hypothetical protein
MAVLTSKQRRKMKKATFAIPERRAYPVNDLAHARAALSRVSAHGTPEEKRRVRAKVARKFPALAKRSKSRGR